MTDATFSPTLIASMEGVVLPNSNFGNIAEVGPVYVGSTKTFLYRYLLFFDVSALIGLYTSIDASQLELNVHDASGTGVAAKVYRNRRQTTVTQAGMTWNKYDGTNAWGTAGANNSSTDYDAVTPTAVAFTTAGSTGAFTITGLAAFITDAIASRSNIVALEFFCDDESPGTTHQNIYTAYVLRVTYTPVTTPASLFVQHDQPARPHVEVVAY